jgi:methionyl-tRNA formyltransferase
MNNNIKIGFFGTPDYAVTTLNILKANGFKISFVVTMPDRPKGRKMVMTPPEAKVWAIENNVPVFQPEKLRDDSLIETLKKHDCDVFVVIAYGKIIPDSILNIPKHKSLNIHGSLLPKYRGSCPIETAILNDDRNTGVCIIQMDSEMDHGPIVASRGVNIDNWPPTAQVLGNEIVKTGANLLVEILPEWIAGKISPVKQDHSLATFTKKIEKEDGLIDLDGDPYKNYLKIQAYNEWPSAFFFKDGKRMKITKASYSNGKLTIEKVIPEGKGEIDFNL